MRRRDGGLSARSAQRSRVALRLAWLLLAVAGCGDDVEYVCADGTCYCERGEHCEIPCGAPPCHVECQGDDTACTAECGNGSCLCGDDSACAFFCHSPPCHVTCAGSAACSGTCANGTCACERGASCDFSCDSGPCHVQCEGDHVSCDGECANGTCACGPRSACRFTCLDDNCAATCAAGSSCVLECSAGRAGEQGCAFERCAAGEPTVCPGGTVVTCGAACP